MATPRDHPLIFLFTGSSGSQFGYHDRFREEDGIYLYTGEGQAGNMTFTRSNRALLEHRANNRRVFLFEVTRKGWATCVGEVELVDHHIEYRPDRDGKTREAIVFHLDVIPPGAHDISPDQLEKLERIPTFSLSLAELRDRALSRSPRSSTPPERKTAVANRSLAVKLYALKRATGFCLGCNKPAPFHTKRGPFLEVHHVYRLADGGPDHPAAVIAICPNCHREVHFGLKGENLNLRLIGVLEELEGEVPEILPGE
jgi:5-methylcytosine-specific restriction protein A